MSPVQSFSLARSAVDILLAAEKDALYEGEVKKELQNLLERILGHRSVAQLLPEISALSSFLYYCLSLRLPFCFSPNQSNYLPFQTLGEESCNLVRVSVKDFYRSTDGTSEQKVNYIPVASTNVGCRLWLSVVSAHLCTYIIDRSRLGWLKLMYVTMTPRNRLEQQLRQQQMERGVIGSNGNRGISNVQPPHSFPARASICILKRFDLWRDSFRAWSRALENGISEDLSPNCIEGLVDWLRQCHLTIFYISATYLAIPSRLYKIQYMFTSDPTQSSVRQSRPNLSILGYILLIRLLVPVTVKSTQILRKWKQNRRRISATAEMRFASVVSSRMQATTRILPKTDSRFNVKSSASAHCVLNHEHHQQSRLVAMSFVGSVLLDGVKKIKRNAHYVGKKYFPNKLEVSMDTIELSII
uniref:RING-type E3 ubiquitin transferase n=1 Tax=Albugo laibachii Nc14 TaxID=890382 RepID=F0W6W0_9STRA|nr:peroxisome assembly protein putative [Albugo laibachii Nc14]|eukprot:CCA16855.1 peroxisome assembly protein putative [Albugo laibachii Nc14]